MRNRSLIAHWVLDNSDGVVSLRKENGKTVVSVSDYPRLRECFSRLLAEIQRIKSEGDFDAARQMVETYAVNVDEALHKEVLERYERLHIAPYKGFINPVMKPVTDENGQICDIILDYSETFTSQMLRYGRDYGTL